MQALRDRYASLREAASGMLDGDNGAILNWPRQ